jgi:hypothetical protein
MTRDETIALWQRCEEARAAALNQGGSPETAHAAARSVWNCWAEERLAERKQLECNKDWRVKHDEDPSWYGQRDLGENGATRDWLYRSLADFSYIAFIGPRNNGGFQEEITDPNYRELQTIEDDVNLSGFIFPSCCDFRAAVFLNRVFLTEAAFYGTAGFRRTAFRDSARFQRAKFLQGAWFARTEFLGAAHFQSAEFVGFARFAGTNFADGALFEDAKFGSVWFRACLFPERAAFGGAIFDGPADFQAMSSGGSFELTNARFRTTVPRFNQATFREAPDFENVVYPVPSFWGLKKDVNDRTSSGGNSVMGAYRALRRMAVQGHNHEQEALAFKGEVRSRRGAIDRAWHAPYWFGIIYDALSDFGRSMMRPFYLWLLSIAAFTMVYLADAGKLTKWKDKCDGIEQWLKALYLSAKSSLPVVGTLRPDEARPISACLYGASANQEQAFPSVSAFIQLGQTLWSAVLIFLFLLAVRNQFKIK